MSPELLDILVCPRSKKKLTQADSATIEEINRRIAEGVCVEISGTSVATPTTEGLVQNETGLFYFVREGIPVLIYENAVTYK
ncbi:MAG TPA: hypothetical protein PLY93_12105 [Turneriella sp.]|nr:hypothetical protein [Turneriella sp.]